MTKTKFHVTELKDFEFLHGFITFRAVQRNDYYELVSFVKNEPIKYKRWKVVEIILFDGDVG